MLFLGEMISDFVTERTKSFLIDDSARGVRSGGPDTSSEEYAIRALSSEPLKDDRRPTRTTETKYRKNTPSVTKKIRGIDSGMQGQNHHHHIVSDVCSSSYAKATTQEDGAKINSRQRAKNARAPGERFTP